MTEPSHPSSSLVEFVPLMRSPATWTPAPVTLPPDIHPLPDDISAYFVYPYTLEDFVLHPPPPHASHRDRIAKLHAEHEMRSQYLLQREEEKVRKRKEVLRKLAPGYEPPEDSDYDSRGGGGGSSVGTGGIVDDKLKKSGILEPTRKNQKPLVDSMDSPAQTTASTTDTKLEEEGAPRDVMDDLVEGLARMDEARA